MNESTMNTRLTLLSMGVILLLAAGLWKDESVPQAAVQFGRIAMFVIGAIMFTLASAGIMNDTLRSFSLRRRVGQISFSQQVILFLGGASMLAFGVIMHEAAVHLQDRRSGVSSLPFRMAAILIIAGLAVVILCVVVIMAGAALDFLSPVMKSFQWRLSRIGI